MPPVIPHRLLSGQRKTTSPEEILEKLRNIISKFHNIPGHNNRLSRHAAKVRKRLAPHRHSQQQRLHPQTVPNGTGPVHRPGRNRTISSQRPPQQARPDHPAEKQPENHPDRHHPEPPPQPVKPSPENHSETESKNHSDSESYMSGTLWNPLRPRTGPTPKKKNKFSRAPSETVPITDHHNRSPRHATPPPPSARPDRTTRRPSARPPRHTPPKQSVMNAKNTPTHLENQAPPTP